MLVEKKVVFIGSGNMAEGILSGVVGQGLVPASQITMTDIRAERLAELADKYAVQTSQDNATAVSSADIIFLAVKPQMLTAVAGPIGDHIPPQALVISILAGTTLTSLTSSLDHPALIRAMPNTPAQIGQSMTVWCETTAVSAAQSQAAQQLFQSFGEEIQVPKESYLDMATAINGSGPGYVFLILEAMIDTAVQMGFARPVAEKLVLQTFLGSVQYAQESDHHLVELRNRVTSPGGTTAAGLYAMEQNGLRIALTEGVLAAYRRSQELGKLAGVRVRDSRFVPQTQEFGNLFRVIDDGRTRREFQR
jgi:pyrroline-5-carboxylate reductase